MTPDIRTVRAKSDKIELYRAALVYYGPLKKSVSTNSRVINEVVLGTDMKIRPPPGGASSIKSLMFMLSKAEQFGVPMRLLPHTGGVYGLWLHQAKPTSDQGDDLSLFSSLRGGPATRAMDHWCENSLGGSSFS